MPGRGGRRRNQEAGSAALRRIQARDSDEDRVTDAFRIRLLAEGRTPVEPTNRWTDLEAVRGDERLMCEAHGRGQPPRGPPSASLGRPRLVRSAPDCPEVTPDRTDAGARHPDRQPPWERRTW
ncbi:hypothetical protein ACF07S_03015 [Streptomyces sp. NPDC016640]|uniref:hypothetical protein n=1 Tax=Streptomyces sp. NPDC016640 TaxID=3364969 RepID=UPI0036FEA63D